MPEGYDCSELLGGPQDGAHVHTTEVQAREGVLMVPVHTNLTAWRPMGPRGDDAVLLSDTPYYLRFRQDNGVLVWVHSSMINAAAQRSGRRRWRDRGGADG